MRQNSDISSPVSFFLDDNENIPIPHLPLLILPGIGTSYNTLSMQNQDIHLNHHSYQQQFHQLSSLVTQQQQQPVVSIPNQVTIIPDGKRNIHLHLWEDVSSMIKPEPSRFLLFRRKKGILQRSLQKTQYRNFSDTSCKRSDDKNGNDNGVNHWMNRGTLTVSWYEGTNSLELQEHVQNSVI